MRPMRVGQPAMGAAQPAGLGTAAQGVVIVAVFALVLAGMLVMAQRQALLAGAGVPSETVAAVATAEPSPTAAEATPVPAPDAGGPGTYTVQAGDSLFSVAAALGIGTKELIHWNKETYPTLQSTPALRAGWVLVTDGPPLPTPRPERTPEPTVPPPQTAGGTTLPVFGPTAFPASGSVTVGYYTVTGASPAQILFSMDANGPYSEWLGQRADASVETSPVFDFEFREAGGACSIVTFDDTPVGATYHVTLPSWVPPADVPAATVEWWLTSIDEMVAHEGHHITLYESYLPQMNAAVLNGTCDSAEAEIVRLWTEARLANCVYDLEEYGYAVGLTIAACGEV